MTQLNAIPFIVTLAFAIMVIGTADAQQPPASGSPGPATQAPAETPQPAPQPGIEPDAVAILKAIAKPIAHFVPQQPAGAVTFFDKTWRPHNIASE